LATGHVGRRRRWLRWGQYNGYNDYNGRDYTDHDYDGHVAKDRANHLDDGGHNHHDERGLLGPGPAAAY
jgi:hypothetical protein